jgi:caffeoyl-CoA O-methyltransferase
MIVDPQVEHYVHHLTPLEHPVLTEMETEAARQGIPIINRSSMQLIRVVLMIKGGARNILEIGTAIGYSAIWLALASPHAHIDTIEHDQRWVKKAMDYIAQAELSERITVHHADALTYAHKLPNHYDCIFIDATKRQYRLLFERYSSRLNKDGIIITDNVLFKGRVAGHPAENRRLGLTAEILNEFNQWLSGLEEFETSFVPIGDGLAISVKKEGFHSVKECGRS